MALIELDNVVYQYPGRDTPALCIPQWHVDESEVVVLAGATGAGKSTLLRTLNGLVPHFSGGVFGGVVRVNGIDTRNHRPAALSRLVGFLAQDPETQVVVDQVSTEIQFALESLGYSPQTARVRTEEVLDITGISMLRNRRIHTLSGGERQRVALAVALATRPNVLVLDEPTSQLDPWTAEAILTTLAQLAADLGITIIMTEHRLERVVGLCTRLAIMEGGQITHDGPPRQVAPHLPFPPPLIKLGRALGWAPLPLSVQEARRQRHKYTLPALCFAEKEKRQQGPAGITVERVSVQFESGQWGLRTCSLRCPQGAVTAIIGRNGAGKTTLLRAIRGLLPIREGRIWINGHDITKMSTEERTRWIGYVPQQPSALFFTSSVAEELRVSLHAANAPVTRLHSLLDQFALSHLLNAHPHDLSTGEQQRLALALALAHDPSVLLLDEPTRGLDPAQKDELSRHLRTLANDGRTIVLTSHDCELVAHCADWVVLLAEGEIVAEGSPRDVLDGTLAYSTQINRVFGHGLLTVEDVLTALAMNQMPSTKKPSFS